MLYPFELRAHWKKSTTIRRILKCPGRKQKLNREKIQAALNTLCPRCGYSITPAEIRRVDFDTMKCPKCGEIFTTPEKRG